MRRRQPHVEVYEDEAGEYRWRMMRSGRNTSNPGEGYTRRWSAQRAAAKEHPGVEIRHVYPDGRIRVVAA